MEHFLNELGIKCLSQPCFVCDKNGESLGSHINNIVYLEDSKYNIKGWYYLDACWDSINKGEEPFLKYAYSLIPVGDVSQMKTRDIKMNGGFFGALYSKEEQKELYNDLVESSVMSGAIAYEMGLEDEFDGLYEYLDGDDAEIIERQTSTIVYRTNKIIIKNPRKIDDDMALYFYQISNIIISRFFIHQII